MKQVAVPTAELKVGDVCHKWRKPDAEGWLAFWGAELLIITEINDRTIRHKDGVVSYIENNYEFLVDRDEPRIKCTCGKSLSAALVSAGFRHDH